MKIRVLCIGKTRNPHMNALCQDYLQRMQRLTPCEWVVLRESPGTHRRNDAALCQDEEKRLLIQLEDSPYSGLMDVGGSEMDSARFAENLEKHRMRGTKQIDFILGGPWGWSDKIRNAVSERLSLSRLTFPHELARVVLLEQLFRALSRIHGTPYGK